MSEYIFIKVIYRGGKIEYYGKRQMIIIPNSNNEICEWDKRYAYQNTSTAARGIGLLKNKLNSMGINQGKWRIIDVAFLTCFED